MESLNFNEYSSASIENRKNFYKHWLLSIGINSYPSYVGTYPKNILSAHGVLLFDHCDKNSLLEKLPIDQLNIDNDKKKTSDSKSSYKNYLAFLEALQMGIDFNENNLKSKSLNTDKEKQVLKNSSNWPTWIQPSDEEILQSTKIGSKYYQFLNPDIIKAITDDNEKHRSKWREGLVDKGIDPELYLWEGSPCAFPGVRRYAGKLERQSFYSEKGENENNKYAVKLDDNSYPKQIWSYVFRNRPFPKHGPVGYTLAHMIDHKDHKNRCADEFIYLNNRTPDVLYGLYSSPANAVYVPSSLYKPTDHSQLVRNLLIRKSMELYGGICNLVPDWMQVKDSFLPDWELERFNWNNPVGSLENIKSFLKYRENEINRLLD
jgi:hypothetical protein